MIKHTYEEDGSFSCEWKEGDVAVVKNDQIETYMYAGANGRMYVDIPKGTKVTISRMEPYSRRNSFLTASYWCDTEDGNSRRICNWDIEPCEDTVVTEEVKVIE